MSVHTGAMAAVSIVLLVVCTIVPAIGQPLLTVPIRVSQEDLDALGTDEAFLCYEIQGAADKYFNFGTDECISVNAHYAAVSSRLNVINQIGIRTVGDDGQCRNILVNVIVECSVSVDGVSLDSTGQYMSANNYFRMSLSQQSLYLRA